MSDASQAIKKANAEALSANHAKATTKREEAVAGFFNALTELVKLCTPLVKMAVEKEGRKSH